LVFCTAKKRRKVAGDKKGRRERGAVHSLFPFIAPIAVGKRRNRKRSKGERKGERKRRRPGSVITYPLPPPPLRGSIAERRRKKESQVTGFSSARFRGRRGRGKGGKVKENEGTEDLIPIAFVGSQRGRRKS